MLNNILERVLRARYRARARRRASQDEEVSCYAGVIASINESRFRAGDKIAFAREKRLRLVPYEQLLPRARQYLRDYDDVVVCDVASIFVMLILRLKFTRIVNFMGVENNLIYFIRIWDSRISRQCFFFFLNCKI